MKIKNRFIFSNLVRKYNVYNLILKPIILLPYFDFLMLDTGWKSYWSIHIH